MLIQSFNICRDLQPAAHERKQLSKFAWQGRLLSCLLLCAAAYFVRISPRKAERKILVIFDIFGLERQIPHCVRWTCELGSDRFINYPMKLDYLLTWFQSWSWRRFSNFVLRFKMADEYRQSDKMALTALLVVLRHEKIEKKKALSQSLQSPLVFYLCF